MDDTVRIGIPQPRKTCKSDHHKNQKPDHLHEIAKNEIILRIFDIQFVESVLFQVVLFIMLDRIELTVIIADINLLQKIKNIPPQSSLDKQGRANNVLNAYAIRTKRLETLKQMAGSRILLVDDVYTTGSTLNECAKTLSKSVNAYICTFTIARD